MPEETRAFEIELAAELERALELLEDLNRPDDGWIIKHRVWRLGQSTAERGLRANIIRHTSFLRHYPRIVELVKRQLRAQPPEQYRTVEAAHSSGYELVVQVSDSAANRVLLGIDPASHINEQAAEDQEARHLLEGVAAESRSHAATIRAISESLSEASAAMRRATQRINAVRDRQSRER